MSKVSEKKLVGQPIFKQIVDLSPKELFDVLVRTHKSDRYYKQFSSWTALISLLFGILACCDSMGEVCDGMQALGGKLKIWDWIVRRPKARQEMAFGNVTMSCSKIAILP